MWKPPVIYLVAAGILAFGAFCSLSAWNWRGSIADARESALVANYSAKLAKGVVDALKVKDEAIVKVQEVNDVRADELARLAATAANRPATVIRVRSNCPVPAPRGREGTNASDEPGTASGVFSGTNGGTVGTYISTEPFRRYADLAESVSADLRACQSAWPR